jgi:hypothetical protein
VVKMPSSEFLRICRDLSTIGDTGACHAQSAHQAAFRALTSAPPLRSGDWSDQGGCSLQHDG